MPQATAKATRSQRGRHQERRLDELPNVGRSLAASFRMAGVDRPDQLIGADPYRLYDALCAATLTRHDPCVLDVFISAVRYMEGAPRRPWWHYTAERKRHLGQRGAGRA